VVVVLCSCLLLLIAGDFLVGSLSAGNTNVSGEAALAAFITAPFSDDPNGINSDVLAGAARYIPNSRLYMRLAEFEMMQGGEFTARAEQHARRAIALSPHNYRPHLLLAAILENKEEFGPAQQSVHAALQLAPGNLQAHWQLGGLLMQSGKLVESLPEYRTVASGDPEYFPLARDIVWEQSQHDAEAVIAITPGNVKARVATAHFLLEKSRPVESAAVFRQAAAPELLAERESAGYLSGLIAAGEIDTARELWLWLFERGGKTAESFRRRIENGGFESDILLDWTQFDWSLNTNKFAQISIDPGIAHGGERSLRLDFLGRETTRLDQEITQLMIVEPRVRYRVTYFVRTDGLRAPQGPRVVISPRASAEWIAASEPAPAGTNDWQQQTLEFIAPGPAVVLAIKQKPGFSYEDPTYGSVWYDDFEVTGLGR